MTLQESLDAIQVAFVNALSIIEADLVASLTHTSGSGASTSNIYKKSFSNSDLNADGTLTVNHNLNNLAPVLSYTDNLGLSITNNSNIIDANNLKTPISPATETDYIFNAQYGLYNYLYVGSFTSGNHIINGGGDMGTLAAGDIVSLNSQILTVSQVTSTTITVNEALNSSNNAGVLYYAPSYPVSQTITIIDSDYSHQPPASFISMVNIGDTLYLDDQPVTIATISAPFVLGGDSAYNITVNETIDINHTGSNGQLVKKIFTPNPISGTWHLTVVG